MRTARQFGCFLACAMLFVSASFAGAPPEVKLTMLVFPADSGATTPAGVSTVTTSVATEIVATPVAGYYFDVWKTEGPAFVADDGAAATTVILTGDATITATFTTMPPVTLLMAVSPDGSGETIPAAGSTVIMRQGAGMDVMAFGADGWDFLRWTVSGSAVVDDAESAATAVTLDGDATLTALFAKMDDLAGKIKMSSTHKEMREKKQGLSVSKDTFNVTIRTTIATDVPFPAAGAPLFLSVTFGDYSFMGSTDSPDARAKYDQSKGGYATFLVKEEGKTVEQAHFRWNSRRVLTVMIKGAPLPDTECGVTNIVDLTLVDDPAGAGVVTTCSTVFGESEFNLPPEKSVPYKGKRSEKNGLISWNVQGELR